MSKNKILIWIFVSALGSTIIYFLFPVLMNLGFYKLADMITYFPDMLTRKLVSQGMPYAISPWFMVFMFIQYFILFLILGYFIEILSTNSFKFWRIRKKIKKK